ncbi:hypothetical protein Fleli_1097 [Bernardetia litoralis DSM 6794]|uniref:Uncharacterized protein n=1 Tax=Bernardetia litoralis (strain ATCC 23117 / DSM 6794 / NBRC 15988 / NCIMB 1366 / Fx l1 / Sio-4) TaxID=880071 RepID=I4AHV0_BERLS|nr:hypothetical protein [Bernardetia litoralis]AFM03535.1 hypothetical protein Fleli_1097 [Bernardetia litoralis DSM 6794]
MLQNNRFIIFLWLLIFIISGVLVQSISKKDNLEATKKSSEFMKEATYQIYENRYKELVYDFGIIHDVRDSVAFAKIERGYSVANNLYENNDMKWSNLKTSVLSQKENDNIFFEQNKELLNYSPSQSSIFFPIHKTVIYQKYISFVDKKYSPQICIIRLSFSQFRIIEMGKEKIVLKVEDIFSPAKIQYFINK